MLVNSQLVYLPLAGILNLVMFKFIIVCLHGPEKLRWGVVNYIYTHFYTTI